jgi:hypothetical protein
MAIAQLIGDELLQAGLIRLQQRLSKRLDVLTDCSRIGGFGMRYSTVQQARRDERECARSGQVTTPYVHGFLLGITNWIDPRFCQRVSPLSRYVEGECLAPGRLKLPGLSLPQLAVPVPPRQACC